MPTFMSQIYEMGRVRYGTAAAHRGSVEEQDQVTAMGPIMGEGG